MTGAKLVNVDNANPLAVGPHIFFKPLPSHIDAMVLGTPGTAESYTVPDNAKWLVLSATEDFYVNPNGTAAAPSSEVADGTGSELNPVGYVVAGGESLSFVAIAACKITISVYSKAG